MILPGTLVLDDELIRTDEQRIIHLQVKDIEERIPAIIELGLIPEMNFVKGLLENMCNDFNLPKDQPLIIGSSNLNQLSYVLGLMIGLQNGAISTLEDQDQTTFNYIGELNNASANNLEIENEYINV
jgi:hypothetical protein